MLSVHPTHKYTNREEIVSHDAVQMNKVYLVKAMHPVLLVLSIHLHRAHKQHKYKFQCLHKIHSIEEDNTSWTIHISPNAIASRHRMAKIATIFSTSPIHTLQITFSANVIPTQQHRMLSHSRHNKLDRRLGKQIVLQLLLSSFAMEIQKLRMEPKTQIRFLNLRHKQLLNCHKIHLYLDKQTQRRKGWIFQRVYLIDNQIQSTHFQIRF